MGETRRSTRAAALLALTFICAGTALGRSDPPAVPFEAYDFHQYIQISGPSPLDVINLDTNAQLVTACVEPSTKEDLRALGILLCESQIEVLRAWRLIEESEEGLVTAFPMLDAPEAALLRAKSAAAAAELAEKAGSCVERLTAALEPHGRRESTYTIVFSYVLDGLVWERFRDSGVLEERAVTATEPWWSGEVWAVYPPRAFSMGTNTISDAGVSLSINWTEDAIPIMLPFVTDWRNFGQMFDDYVASGRVTDAEAYETFAPYGLFDETGTFVIPVLTEERGDAIFEACSALADLVADSIPGLVDLDELASRLDLAGEEQTIVVVYHEIMWDLMDRLEAKGFVSKPVALADPGSAAPSDIGSLAFVTRRGPARP